MAATLAGAGLGVFLALFAWVAVRALRERAAMPFREAAVLSLPVAGLGLGAALAAGGAGQPGRVFGGAAFDALQLTVFAAVGLCSARCLGREPVGPVAPALAAGIAVGSLCALWTGLLFRLGAWAPSLAAAPGVAVPGVPDSSLPWLPLGLLLLRAALAEELLYRLGIQWHLERALARRPWGPGVAWLTTAGLWTAIHLASVEPAWLRALQLLPVGLALGLLGRSRGVLACAVAHGVLNLATLVPGVVPPAGLP